MQIPALAGSVLFRFFAIILLFTVALSQAGEAQQRTVVNPSFEANNPNGNPGFQYFANAVVPGWDSTNGTVELWDSGFNGVASFAGVVHAEINSTGVGAMYQNVCFTNGEPLRWSFAHRARTGASNPQTATYEIATSAGVLIQTLATQVTTVAQGWQVNANNTGLVTYTGPTGIQRLQFRALDPGSVGNFIDDIRILLAPYVEFGATAGSQIENAVTNSLASTLVVSGNFDTATTLALRVTGGTATLGTDYITPTGTANFSVLIPAGNYNNQSFITGIRLIGDQLIEGDETIIVSVGAGAGYALASTSSCGTVGRTNIISTIIDDDLNLITTKTANVSSAANGTNVTFTVQVRNAGPIAGTNVSLSENLPAGMTLISATPSAGTFTTPIWTIPSLANGASATLTVVAQVNANTAGGSSLVNSVTAARGTDQGDPTTVGDDLTETITVPVAPAMTILKTSSPASYSTVGTALTFSIAVTNSGNVVYPSAPAITDAFVTSAGGSVSCPSGPVAIGATIVCTANYAVTQADVDAGRVTNVASGAITLGSTQVNATDDVIVPGPAAAPAITLDKTITAGAPFSAPGQTVSYSYLITNTGNITLTAPISVNDNKIAVVSCPAMPASGLPPLATLSCTATYRVTQADLDAGLVTNEATGRLTQPVIPANPGDPSFVVVISPTDTATANASQLPALSVDKRIKVGSASSYGAVGDTVTFEYVVRNTGNVTTTAPVTISDDKIPGILICAPTGFEPGASAICEQVWTADQAALDAGSVTNTAVASTAYGGATVNSAPDTATVTAVQNPELSMDKSLVSPVPTIFDVGQVLNYSYAVTNSGNVTIDGPITVSDNLTAVSCPVVASLLPSVTLNCTASYTIGISDLLVGSTTNVATASGTFGGNPVRSTPDSVTFPVTATAALSIAKSTSTADFGALNDTLSYRYLVTNSGLVGFTGDIFVDDDKTGPFVCRAATLGTFSVNATYTCTRTYTVTQADLDRGFVTNTATARTIFAPGTPNELDVQSPPDAVTVPAVENAELTVTKTVTPLPGPAQVGDVLRYQITTTNTGNQTIRGVAVSDPLLASLSCTVGGVPAPSNVVLIPQTALICTGSYTVEQADIDRQDLDAGVVVLRNTATARGSDPQGAPLEDSASATYPLAVAAAAIDTVKVIEPAPGLGDAFSTLGQSVNFRVTVANTGNITLNNIRVTDDLAPSVTCIVASLAPGDSDTSCTFSYAVTQADLDAQFGTQPNTYGGFFNTATATAQPANPGAPEISDDGTVFAKGPVGAPQLSLAKTPVTATFAAPGDTLTYTYTVANIGNVTLTAQPVVTDDKIGSFNCGTVPIGGLRPANFITCTADYVVTQADVDAGAVTNIASVASTDAPLPAPPGPAQDTATVTGIRTPGMTVDKVPSVTGTAPVGTVIDYAYTVTNSGTVTLTAITPDDQHTNAAGTVALAIAGDALAADAGPATGDSTDVGINGIWDRLAPGDSVSFTASYTVTQADVDAGTALTNTVTVTSQSPAGTAAPVAVASASVDVAVANPVLSVIKTASTAGLSVPAAVDDVLDYTISVENTGNVTISTVALLDTLTDAAGAAQALDGAPTLTGGDDGDGLLQVDETWIYTAQVTLTQSMIDAGGLSNTVTASGQAPDATRVSDVSDDDGTGTDDPTVTTLGRNPAIAVVKTATLNDGGDGRADVGDSISYAYTVSNEGNTTLFDLGLTETGFTGAGVTPVPVLTAGGADLDGDADAPDLGVGATATYRVDYLLVQADIDAGVVSNQATVAANGPDGGPVQDLSGATTEDDLVTDTALGGTPGLLVLKAASTAGLSVPPAVDDVLDYTISVENTGNVTISTVALLDTLTDAAGAAQALDGAPTLTGGDDGDGLLQVDETWIYTAQVTMTQSMIDAGGLSNTVTASGQAPDASRVSDVSDDDGTGIDDPTVTTLGRVATLTVGKLPSITADAAAGDVISYTYTVENTGNVLLNAVTVDDQHTSAAGTVALPIAGDTLATDAGVAGNSSDAAVNGVWDTLGPGDIVTFTSRYTVTQADVDAGADLANTVTVSAAGPTGTTVPDASTTVAVSVEPAGSALTVLKSAVIVDGGDGIANAGDTLRYRYVVNNPGNVTLFDVGVLETGFTGAGTTPAPALLSGGADLDGEGDAIDLAPGASATFEAEYALLQADIDVGDVTNQATASANDLQGNPVTDLSGATAADNAPTVTLLVSTPAFDVVKSALAPVYLFPTVERVTFTIDVTNAGNVTQTGVQVDDDLAAFVAPAVLLAATYPVTTTATGFTGGAANAAYDGIAVTALLTGNPTLLPGASGQITITLTYSTANGAAGGSNIANVRSDQLAGPTPSNPVAVPGGDTDGDGVPDSLEGCGPGDDRDGDSICDAQDYDPIGTFYCEEDGRILTGGDVSVTGPLGTQSGVGSSSGITIVRSGADGRFQFFVTAAGSYTLALTYPPGGVASTTRPSSGTLDVTSLLPSNPGSLGSGEAGFIGQLVDFSAGANTYYTTFVFEEGDPFLINNNIPLSACAIRQGVIATKVADRETAVVGETITFTLSFNNTTSVLYADADILDVLPEGLAYTPGSGILNGVATEPVLTGQRLNWGPRDVAAGEQITIRLSARVTAAAGVGKLVNRALMLDQLGVQISNTATATVLIKAEQVFSCSDVIGKVFVDRNGNGAQDADPGRAALTQDEIFLNKYGKLSAPTMAPPTVEQGLAGVRLATVNGLLITTDEFGRYHVPCAALPQSTGSNFTLKLDPRSLPLGYTVTTENPRTLRLTAGKVAKMNFAVSDTKAVQIDLTAQAFVAGSTAPNDALARGIKALVADIRSDPSSLQLTYALKSGEDRADAVARLQVVEKMIRKAWRKVGRYELQIQKSVKRVQ